MSIPGPANPIRQLPAEPHRSLTFLQSRGTCSLCSVPAACPKYVSGSDRTFEPVPGNLPPGPSPKALQDQCVAFCIHLNESRFAIQMALPFFNEGPAVSQHPNTSDGGPNTTQKLKRPAPPRTVLFKAEHQASQNQVPRLNDAFAPNLQNMEETQHKVDRRKLNVDP